MIKAIDTSVRIEFSSKNDTTDPKTIFILRPLSGMEMMQFTGGGQDDVLKMVSSSLVDVKNFPSKWDNIIDVCNMLSINTLGELISKINEINSVTEQDQKN